MQLSIRSTGICGSDQHYYNHFRNGDIHVREPMSLGHESSGVVELVGPGPNPHNLRPGDRVAVEVGVPCDGCARCAEGRYNICAGMRFRSSAKSFPHFQGTLQERVNHPARWCHRLPENVSLDEGALLEPLSVAIHAVRRVPGGGDGKGSALRGKTALVLGAGAVGLLTAAVLRTARAGRIVVADIEAGRVAFAEKHGFADAGVALPRKRPASDAAEDKLALAQETASFLMEKGNGNAQYDVVFECTGVETCVQTGIYAAAAGGAVMLVGMGTPVQTLPVSAAALREVDLLGVFRYARTYEYGLGLLADRAGCGMPDVSRLATHRFKGLGRAADAFAAAGRPTDNEGNVVLKVIIES